MEITMYRRAHYNSLKEEIENDKNISPYLSSFLIGWLHLYFNRVNVPRYNHKHWLKGHDIGKLKELMENDTSYTFKIPD
jgi:hypothetical protein